MDVRHFSCSLCMPALFLGLGLTFAPIAQGAATSSGMYAEVTTTVDNLVTINGHFSPNARDAGKRGAYFAMVYLPSSVAIAPDSFWYFDNALNPQPFNCSTITPIFSVGRLVDRIQWIFPTPTDLSPYAGAQLYLGYGLGLTSRAACQNMLAKGTTKLAYTLPAAPAPSAYTIGGRVTGLTTGQTVVLLNQGGDALTVSTNGAFTFPIVSNAYAVTVGTQPQAQTCTVSNGRGTASNDVTNIAVDCVSNGSSGDSGGSGGDSGGSGGDSGGSGDPNGGGNSGGSLSSIDTGSDPQFPMGDIKLAINNAIITVKAGHKVQTAAGIYKADGTLVRTLWRRRIIEANGSTSMTWDYKDDLGQTVPDAVYKVNVIAHNIEYKWQGVIGNTSNPGASGTVPEKVYSGLTLDVVPNIHRSFHPITSISIGPNGVAFMSTGYNEGQHGIARFDIGNPQKKILLAFADFRRVYEIAATDGITGYFANTGNYGGDFNYWPENFIIGIDAASNKEKIFQAGSRRDPWGDAIWQSVIDTVPDGSDPIRGLAVETNGSNLYVAHKNSGIKIIDKTTGICANKTSPYAGNCGASFAVPDPYDMTLAPNGDLWIVTNNRTEIRQYRNPATSHELVKTLTGFGKVTGLGISPLTSTLVVVDAGPDQQLKAFNTGTGAALWTHGVKGGYVTNGPKVTTEKLYLTNPESDHNYVAFEPNTNEELFWVGEPGNYRSLKFKIPSSPAAYNPLEYKDQILYAPHSYNAAVDKANPTRVFNTFLEYSVDYSKPINQSWTLVRNWNTGLTKELTSNLINGPRDVFTTPQGKTFALLEYSRSKDGHNTTNRIYELTEAGLRDTGIAPAYGTRFHENMSLRFQRESGQSVQIMQKDFTGIDGQGNPVYSAEKVVATVPVKNAANQYNPFINFCAFSAQEPQFPKTSTGIIITFDPCAFATSDYNPSGNHLGGVKEGSTDYIFRASPGGAFTVDQYGFVINGDGAFNLEKLSQNYAANAALASGRHVLYGYHGEFWNNSQANQWMHWMDNGLFLGQFGVTAAPVRTVGVVAGTGGNTFSTSMINVDGNIYIYHNDEHAHAGVHRWRVQNLNSLQEMVGNIGKNTAVTNPAEITSKALSL